MDQSYSKSEFSAAITDGTRVSHEVYTKGYSKACIVILQELPGIGPETIALANTLADRNFRVVVPHLFGPLGKISLVGNMVRVMCLRREFSLFANDKSSPIVDWLRALCSDLRQSQGVDKIGVIGMCLTGNFAISLMAEEQVLAGVASQPSMPLFKHDALHMSSEEVANTRAALSEKGPMLALRFSKDPLCTAEKFDALDRAFNDDQERIKFVELPGRGHSVLTLDFIRAGQPAQDALENVIDYFSQQLTV